MIVIGVDERPAAGDALALGGWLAGPLGEDLLLVFVHGSERPPSKLASVVRTPTLVRRRLEADAIETAVRALARDTAAALPPGLRCELRLVAADSPASGLARVAREERASMLVLGTSERAGVGRILPGSTALRLLSGGSSAPVAIAPRHYIDRLPDAPVIGVGFDGGPEAELALASADRLARAVGGRLRVAAVHEPAAFSHVSTDNLVVGSEPHEPAIGNLNRPRIREQAQYESHDRRTYFSGSSDVVADEIGLPGWPAGCGFCVAGERRHQAK